MHIYGKFRIDFARINLIENFLRLFKKKYISIYTLLIFCIILTNKYSIASTENTVKNYNFKVSFNQSMAPSAKLNIYNSDFANQDQNWQLAQKLYEKNIINNFKYQEKVTIPKIVHQIWIGSPLPQRLKRLQKSWKAHHPDWEYKLWTDKEIEQFGLHNKKLYNSLDNLAQKSDIARYEILYRIGGLYVDTDFECIKSFNIWHHSLDFYVGIEFNKNLRANNALIGASPKHPILKACIENMGKEPIQLGSALSPIEIFIENSVQLTGPAFLTKMIIRYLSSEQYNSDNKIVLFPNTFFYPFNAKEDLENNQFIKPETFGIHYWDMSWIKSDTN